MIKRKSVVLLVLLFFMIILVPACSFGDDKNDGEFDSSQVLNVILDANGGECAINSISVKYGNTYELPEPQRSGYAFKGWYSDNIKIDDEIWIYSTSTVKAEWEKLFEFSGNILLGATDYCKTQKLIEIPKSIDNNNIQYIQSKAFVNCNNVENIIIPTTILGIGLGAFSGCTNLKEITIPFVGSSVFNTTSSQETFFGYIFGDEEYVGGCGIEQKYKNFTSTNTPYKKVYYFPNSLRKVCVLGGSLFDGSFYGCKNLQEIELPNSVTNIASYAFYYCSSLKHIDLPESLIYIGSNSFACCTSIKTVTLPNNVSNLGIYAFLACTSLQYIKLSNTLRDFDRSVFKLCDSLETLIIPQSVIKITDISSNQKIDNLTVYYCGDVESFRAINGKDFIKERVYCYSKESPANVYYGNYGFWHYADDGETIIEW